MTLPGIRGYCIFLGSSNSGVTVLVLNHLLRNQSLDDGWETWKVNIDCWTAGGNISSDMIGYHNWKFLGLGGNQTISWHLLWHVLIIYQSWCSSNNSGVTTKFLQNMLRNQSLVAGQDTREVNINCWIVARSPQSVMRGLQNWKKIGFKWNPISQLSLTIAWDEWLSDLLDIKKQWGNCDVIQKYAKYSKLGGWARHPRNQYTLLKSGKKSSISDERIEKLKTWILLEFCRSVDT